VIDHKFLEAKKKIQGRLGKSRKDPKIEDSIRL